jgi:hypothetical protein
MDRRFLSASRAGSTGEAAEVDRMTRHAVDPAVTAAVEDVLGAW